MSTVKAGDLDVFSLEAGDGTPALLIHGNERRSMDGLFHTLAHTVRP